MDNRFDRFEKSTVKFFLRRVLSMQALVERKTVQVQEMESSLIYKGMTENESGGFGSPDVQKRNKALAKWITLKDELQKQIETLVKMKDKAIRMIDSLDDAKQLNIFYMHYLEGVTWTDIAEGLGITNQWVHELHKKGLQELQQKYPEFAVNSNQDLTSKTEINTRR